MPPANASLLPSLALGFALVVGGLSLLRWHARQARELRQSPANSQAPMQSAASTLSRRQLRRRCQIAWLLVLLGVLVPVGDWWVTRHPHPVTFTLYILLLLTLAGWLLLLGVVDGLSVRAVEPSVRAPSKR